MPLDDGRKVIVKGSCYRVAEDVNSEGEPLSDEERAKIQQEAASKKRIERHVIIRSVPEIALLEYTGDKALVRIVGASASPTPQTAQDGADSSEGAQAAA